MKKLKSNISRFFKDVKTKHTESAVYQIANEGLAIAMTHTPVDTSNLINSVFSPVIDYTGGKVTATVGYNAEYAGHVHDAPGTLKGEERASGNGVYWSPDASPRFLEKGFKELESSIPSILKAIYETK